MNGYIMLAESQRYAMEKGMISKEVAEKSIRVYDFLATCDIDDLCIMIDSTAFNDIIRAFLKKTVQNAGLDEESQDKVNNQLRWVFDGKTAKEILQDYLKD